MKENNNIPYFVLIFDKNHNLNNKSLDGKGKVIFSSLKCKIVVENTDSCDLSLYKKTEESFLWTGGYNVNCNNIDEFEYNSCSDKFIYVNFSENSLTIYSDHYSKIPLFYYETPNSFCCSTSLSGLLKVISENEINLEGLLFYYNFGFSPYNNYLVNNVSVLEGGMKISLNQASQYLKKTPYYSLQDIKYSNKDFAENKKLVDQFLLNATSKTVSNHNNIGIALSGGVDSGYLAQKIHESNGDFKAYTLGFKNDYNEFDRIDYLSKKLNFKANKIIIDANQIIDNYLEVSSLSSFPVEFNNSILNFIYKKAKYDNVDVMFDGDGADRLFLGMNKYLELNKMLKFYSVLKSTGTKRIVTKLLAQINNTTLNKMNFYFSRFNDGFNFYGERKLSNSIKYDLNFEERINKLALPEHLHKDQESGNWSFFTKFSIHYTPTFFFHTPYELQLRHGLISNPQFWTDDLVKLALSIPVNQKLTSNTTKKVLREAAKSKIDDGYWNLSKIGLQSAYQYLKKTKIGLDFVESYKDLIRLSDEYLYLKEVMPEEEVQVERLISYHIWKKEVLKK